MPGYAVRCVVYTLPPSALFFALQMAGAWVCRADSSTGEEIAPVGFVDRVKGRGVVEERSFAW